MLCVQQSVDGTGALRVRPAVGPGAAGAPLHGGKTRQLSHVEVSVPHDPQLHVSLSARTIMAYELYIYGCIHSVHFFS